MQTIADNMTHFSNNIIRTTWLLNFEVHTKRFERVRFDKLGLSSCNMKCQQITCIGNSWFMLVLGSWQNIFLPGRFDHVLPVLTTMS